MNFKKLFFLFGCIVFMSVEGYSTVHLPAIISNNMVLQRSAEVPLWGTSTRHGVVSVLTSWNHRRYQARCDEKGNWKVLIRTPAAGGPFQITFDDGDQRVLSGILIGEVWVCSGQSNMEIPLKGYQNTPILDANRVLMHAGDSSLRLFHVTRATSYTPLDDCGGDWEISGSESAATFSAVGFQFARKLQAILGVPVGIIETSWGGTPIEAWMSSESLARFGKVVLPQLKAGQKPNPHSPTTLYNAMINPIAGFGIKGFIWYQGEANRHYPNGYRYLMESMVQQWRGAWKLDSLPFYYVQIAPFAYGKKDKDSVPYLREEQAMAEKLIPHSGMVVTMDVGNEFTIHPPDKTTVAVRLLYWALGDTYGRKGLAFESPSFHSMRIDSDKVLVSLSPAPMGLTCFDQPVTGFEVAGNDHIYYPATAKILRKGTVAVHADQVAEPVAVRYGFKPWVLCNLYSTEGLPVAPFRSDHP